MEGGDCLVFFVNGKKIVETKPNPEHSLLYYLRNVLGLKGSKMGCGEGGCGACTVMLSKYDRQKKEVGHISVYACLTPVCRVHEMAVTTVEGIGSTKTKLHPVQERIARFHGSQCGFCTPGIVMSMYTLLRKCPEPSQRQIEEAFDGNLCRCTGYRPILDAFKTFSCPEGEQCCRVKKKKKGDVEKGGGVIESEGGMGDPEGLSPLDPSQDLIFPPELLLLLQNRVGSEEKMLSFRSGQVSWYRPVTLTQVLQLKQTHPEAKLVNGGIGLCREIHLDSSCYPVVICDSEIPELTRIEETAEGLLVGAAATLTQLAEEIEKVKESRPSFQTQILTGVTELLERYAGSQVRNLACLGGSLMSASPTADLNTLLLAARAQLTIMSSTRGKRRVFVEQQQGDVGILCVEGEEVIESVLIPWTSAEEAFCVYKQAKRRTCAEAIVNCAFWIRISRENNKIQDCRLAFGGMAPKTILAEKSSKGLIGCEWKEEVVERGLELLRQELSLPSDVPGGMPEYREVLAGSFFFKFYLFVTQQQQQQQQKHSLRPEQLSGLKGVSAPLTESTQVYEEVPGEQSVYDPVGRPIIHQSAYKQATGEAKYLDDIPLIQGEVYAAPVLSTRSHARIVSIDAREALSLPGVHSFVTHQDIPKGNSNGNMTEFTDDEQIFAEFEVTCDGQLIGMIVAEDPLIARRAARAVRVSYEDLPTITTIEEAIESSSFFPFDFNISRGDVRSALSECEYTDSGEIRIGGQEHFYFETQCCLAVPSEDGGMDIISSTQCLNSSQMFTAKVLGVEGNKVTCKTKRIGGGFGGKDTMSTILSASTAVAASKLGRPVRCILHRDDDMKLSGGRHPMLAKYTVGYQSDGKIKALQINLYSNAGSKLHVSGFVMNRALLHLENTYFFPNYLAKGFVCRTNLPSNTAFRGFGAPQSMFFMENILNGIAARLNQPQNEIRFKNFYVDGQTTPYGMPITSCQIQRCWEMVLEKSNYQQLVEETQKFNVENAYKKRGISVIPTKLAIASEYIEQNQGGALIHILKDGSVLVAHGGVEMGQGLHTKIIQVCSRALGIPISKIFINETSTNTIANSCATGGSISSDIYGLATLNACNILNERLAPIKKNDPNNSWEDWINTAYLDRINLSAQDFCKIDNLSFDWKSGTGSPFSYFTYGCACTLVEVDVLTGDFKVLKTDIVMDVGKSLNPAIDVGQIEGAFVQGMGLFTIEEMVYLNESKNVQKGTVFTCGPGTYKIPSFSDIPANLRVHLLHNAPNERAVYSSKGIGEPPLFLGSSVFFAIKDAISSVRRDNGSSLLFSLDAPATPEKIRLSCCDFISNQVLKARECNASNDRWNIIP